MACDGGMAGDEWVVHASAFGLKIGSHHLYGECVLFLQTAVPMWLSGRVGGSSSAATETPRDPNLQNNILPPKSMVTRGCTVPRGRVAFNALDNGPHSLEVMCGWHAVTV